MRSLTWFNGGKYFGECKDNKQWNGTIYDPNGNIIAASTERYSHLSAEETLETGASISKKLYG